MLLPLSVMLRLPLPSLILLLQLLLLLLLLLMPLLPMLKAMPMLDPSMCNVHVALAGTFFRDLGLGSNGGIRAILDNPILKTWRLILR